jgi:uncharacterized coiled-coil DUF342 family protein
MHVIIIMSSALQTSYHQRQTAFNEIVRAIRSSQAMYANKIPEQIKQSLQRDLIIATTNLLLILQNAGADKKRMCDARTMRDNASMRKNIDRVRPQAVEMADKMSDDIADTLEVIDEHHKEVSSTYADITQLSADLKALISQRF